MRYHDTVVLLATRGLVFTQTIEYLLKNGLTNIILTHDLPIPEAQNWMVDHLNENWTYYGKPEYLFFIEEDIVPPPHAYEMLREALEKDSQAGIACIDYALQGGQSTVQRSKETNDVLFCALGCTLVKAEVFTEISKPYFRTDKALRANDLEWIDIPKNTLYGMLDVWFTWQVRQAGYKIVKVGGECTHLKVQEYAAPGTNDGCHTITTKGEVTHHMTL